MASPQPVQRLLVGLSRSTQPAQYVCRPCLRSKQQRLISNDNSIFSLQKRSLHQNVQASAVPRPTPFVPDVATFLSLIGRGMSTHSSKITSWESLFKLSSAQLKDLGVEPARSRRYLLRWRDKFRKGEFGIGGDLKFVADGVGHLRVVEVPSLPTELGSTSGTRSASISHTPGMTKLIVNVPEGSTTYQLESGQTTKDLKKPNGLKLKDGRHIVGSYVQPVQGSHGSAAILKVTEGMWEHKRGRKIHGGERRRAETLHKLRVAERKNA